MPTHRYTRQPVVGQLPAWVAPVGCVAAGSAAAVGVGHLLGNAAVLAWLPLLFNGALLGLLVAQLAVPGGATGPVRQASLLPRRTAGYVSPRRRWAWRAAAGAGVAGIVAAALAGNSDGRSLTTSCPGPLGGGVATVSPWPGWTYGVAPLVVLLGGVVLVELIVARAVRRPRADPAVVNVSSDEARRVASVRAGLCVGLALALVTVGEVALACLVELGNLCDPGFRPLWVPAVAASVGMVGVVAMGGALVSLRSLWFPRRAEWS